MLTPSDILGVEVSQLHNGMDASNSSTVDAAQPQVAAADCQLSPSLLDEHPQRMRAPARASPVEVKNDVFELRLIQAAARREGRGLKVWSSLAPPEKNSLVMHAGGLLQSILRSRIKICQSYRTTWIEETLLLNARGKLHSVGPNQSIGPASPCSPTLL